ncbi:pilus assembly protein [Orbus sturtevantii]|uniref:TadE/TadG family type IV pilus assembly protein n=1 Tax=Orbus sturtevantii TaxID=3074109 RepID=UPI00370D24F7
MMRRFNHSFLMGKTGAISIEFAIIVPMLILLFLFVLEMSRIMLIGSALDLVSTQISRKTTVTENINQSASSYSVIYRQALADEVPGWGIFTSLNNFTIAVNFCNSISDVINNRCNETQPAENKIILFDLQYQYSAIFSSLFSKLIDASLNKKVVVYREFYS